MTDLDWQLRGACRAHPDLDADAWFPHESDLAAAKTATDVCRKDCAVVHACAAWALDHGERSGIWGGLTAKDRRKILRERAKDVDRETNAVALYRKLRPGMRSDYQAHVAVADAFRVHHRTVLKWVTAAASHEGAPAT